MRMGYLNVHDLKILPKMADGIELPKTIPMDLCTACVKAKMHETTYQNEGKKVSRPFEFLYCDVVTNFPVATPEGYTNSVTLIEKFSNYTWVENFLAEVRYCTLVNK